jgi:hypothetical protein
VGNVHTTRAEHLLLRTRRLAEPIPSDALKECVFSLAVAEHDDVLRHGRRWCDALYRISLCRKFQWCVCHLATKQLLSMLFEHTVLTLFVLVDLCMNAGTDTCGLAPARTNQLWLCRPLSQLLLCPENLDEQAFSL